METEQNIPKLEVNIPELIEKYNSINKEIEEKTKEKDEIFKVIGDNYVLYLKELLKKKDDWYFYGCKCYHLGKFISLYYCNSEEPAEFFTVNNRPYSNMHDAIFEVKECITGDLQNIAARDKNILVECKAVRLPLDYHEMDGVLRFYSGYEISKESYENARSSLITDIEKFSHGEYGDYKCGDKIRYIKHGKFNVGTIVFIKGKTAFLDNGDKVVLSTAKVEHAS